MSCEFNCIKVDNQRLSCKRTVVLRQMRLELEGIFTIVELNEMLCNAENQKALEQCFAFLDLQMSGRMSSWAK